MFTRAIQFSFTAAMLASAAAPAWAVTQVKEEYVDLETKELLPFAPGDTGGTTRAPTVSNLGRVVLGFEGISQYDVAAVRRNFIPPDTVGAVGTTQYTSFVNGGFAVFDKSNGSRLQFKSDLSFWADAGQTGANGDSRVLFDKASGRWLALAFSNDVSRIQIAVSDTADATGTWKSTVYTGFAGNGFGGAVADYPTLAIDTNAIYIGTNNFGATQAGGPSRFSGTTLSIIPRASIFGAGGPTIDGRATVETPFSFTTGGNDGGFAIQGVNSTDADTKGRVIAASLFINDVIRYDINGVNNLPTASLTPTSYIGTADYDGNGPGRQPNQVPDANPNATFSSNDRVVDTLDSRIGSSVFQVNGRIYAVYTVTPVGGDHTYIRYDVVDANTNKILDEGHIGDGVHDFYQGSVAVNAFGQVVIGYNRSGSEVGTGNITFAARIFSTGVGGQLTARGDELVLKVSLVDDYHNGSVDGQVAAGRQRFGDYSSVTLDPNDPRNFWAIGEFAREYNNAAGGHPGGTGGSRWSTWIAEINAGTAVPEPASWAMLIAGFGLVGATLRRRRMASVAA